MTILACHLPSDSMGTHDPLGLGQDSDLHPRHWGNRYRYMDNHYGHDLRPSGYAVLPCDFTIGINASWRSAFRAKASSSSTLRPTTHDTSA